MNQLTALRISDSELSELLPNFSGDSASRLEHFAFAAWATICEPGDGFAGLLVNTLGATRALEAELLELDALELEKLLIDSGADFFDTGRFGNFAKSLFESRQRWKPRKSLGLVTQALTAQHRIGGFTITPADAVWPNQLDDLEFHKPFALWVRGNSVALEATAHSAAIVGCRGASDYGEYATGQLVESLLANNYAVVSGGAYGIDCLAHRATMALGGTTIAIMAGGADRLYPAGNANMLRQVISTGAVVAELPPGAAPTKWRFLQRNRIIAALSQSTTVVEANWRSGSLNTVGHAEALGRKIFAVPGPITSPKSAGTNKLIAYERARLIIDGNDLIAQLEDRVFESKQPIANLQLGALETRALDAIGFNSLELAEICASAGLTRDEARIALGSLELDGLIVRRGTAWSSTKQTTV